MFEGKAVETIMRGSVKALVDMKWDGLKLDSCSQFNNLSWWADLINQTGRDIEIENCHQGGFAPGMQQWQTYVKNTSHSHSGAPGGGGGGGADGYEHRLGYLRLGNDVVAPIHNTTYGSCKAVCDTNATCAGFCFQNDAPVPKGPVDACYLKNQVHFDAMDLSQSGR